MKHFKNINEWKKTIRVTVNEMTNRELWHFKLIPASEQLTIEEKKCYEYLQKLLNNEIGNRPDFKLRPIMK